MIEVAQAGVGDHDQTGRQRGGQGLDGGGERRQLRGGSLVRPEIDRHPGRDGRLQGLDLAGDGPVGGPAPGDQVRAAVMPGEADRGQVQVQPGGVRDREPADGGEHQLAADVIGDFRQGFQGAAEPVVVQQRRRGPEQLGDRGRGRPPGDVIQRRGRAQPAGGQHGRDLAVAGQRLAAARDRGVDDPGHAQGPQVVRHDQQRPDAAAGARRRLVQPGQPGGQLLQLPAGSQLIKAAKVCHNMLAHPAALPVAFDQFQVLVTAAAAADRLHLGIHVATTLGAGSGARQRTRRENTVFTVPVWHNTRKLRAPGFPTNSQATALREDQQAGP